jgi:hypothetical protein
MLVSDAFGVAPPKTWTNGKATPLPNPDPSLIYGLELEIEEATPEWEISGIRAAEDGSLRNDGWEFITSPATYSNVVFLLGRFFSNAGLQTDNSRNYSERTSTHIHTNCTDLTIEQVTTILLLYQVFEDLLFQWIGADRKDNIFCVPWSQTQLTHGALTSLKSYVEFASVDRNKYTAVNIVPLKTLGTSVWRRMPGTCNVERMSQWMRLIAHMYRIARSNDLATIQDRLINLNTTSEYERLIDWVFQDDAAAIKLPMYRQFLEEGVLNMKYSLNKEETKRKQPMRFYVDEPAPIMEDFVQPERSATARQHDQMIHDLWLEEHLARARQQAINRINTLVNTTTGVTINTGTTGGSF